MASESSKIIQQFVVAPLSAALRQLGFRKSARTWRRSQPECIQVLGIQGSSWNSSEDVRVTVNLGVYYPAVAALLDRPLLGRAGPIDPDCHIQQRIGFLLPGNLDRWWALSLTMPAAQATEVGAELCDAALGPAIAWLDEHRDLALTRDDHVRANSPWLAAVDSLALGDRQRAVLLLEQAMAGYPLGAERMSAWGHVNGLLPAPAG